MWPCGYYVYRLRGMFGRAGVPPGPVKIVAMMVDSGVKHPGTGLCRRRVPAGWRDFRRTDR